MPERSRFGRRRLLGGGAVALGAAGLGTAALAAGRAEPGDPGLATEPFHGVHQAGIATRPRARISYLAFDLRPGVGRDDLAGLLRIWTEDSARLTAGRPALTDTEPELALRPARLTVTAGLGPGAFAAAGLEAVRPEWLAPLPAFPIDRLDPRWCGGDLLLQLAADEATAVAHAARVLARSVRSLVTPRWVQRGFLDAAPGQTPRNLMGQLDGSANPEGAELAGLVWLDSGPLAGGSALVLRRIETQLDTWEELDPVSRELVVGRRIADGAPLSGHRESDEPDLAATDALGIPLIPPSSHVARARHAHAGERFLRRAYNYDDPPEPGATSNSGLLFAAYQRDIAAQFLPVQRRLAEFDALNQWTAPIGSAVFAVLPGVPAPGGYLGQPLFEG
ncbi:Dyp-type peroxidase [Nocardia harenae]|uniref:Dyp-type peroxidase n=1 Tax=Nocardia harenae TaxID=358707 RepID=UPI00082C4A91|nr:Dyp-type peroxidase [Nocardia harenae]